MLPLTDVLLWVLGFFPSFQVVTSIPLSKYWDSYIVAYGPLIWFTCIPPSLWFFPCSSPPLVSWKKTLDIILARIHEWSHRLPFWVPEFTCPSASYLFPSGIFFRIYIFFYIYFICYTQVNWSFYPYLLRIIIENNCSSGGAWLATHLLTWFSLMFLYHSSSGYPHPLVKILPQTFSGNILVYQRWCVLLSHC